MGPLPIALVIDDEAAIPRHLRGIIHRSDTSLVSVFFRRKNMFNGLKQAFVSIGRNIPSGIGIGIGVGLGGAVLGAVGNALSKGSEMVKRQAKKQEVVQERVQQATA